MASDEPASADDVGSVVQLDYIKSNHFRVVYADGAIGSVSPNGMIQMALFSERDAIPRSVQHEVTEEGMLGAELNSVRRPGYVREVDVNVVMTPDTAKELMDWLSERIRELTDIEEKGATK